MYSMILLNSIKQIIFSPPGHLKRGFFWFREYSEKELCSGTNFDLCTGSLWLIIVEYDDFAYYDSEISEIPKKKNAP